MKMTDKDLEESEKKLAEQRAMLVLTIESVTGMTFEVHVPSFLTVRDVKEHIEIVSGIEADKQHLVYKSVELSDFKSLYEYGIMTGAKLQLIPAMEGGPITRRRYMPPEDVADVLLLDGENETGKRMVAVVVVGGPNQQYHFIQILDGDSDDSDEMSDEESEDEEELERRAEEERRKSRENLVTRNRMIEVRQRMAESAERKANHGASRSPDKNPTLDPANDPSNVNNKNNQKKKNSRSHERTTLPLVTTPGKTHNTPVTSSGALVKDARASKKNVSLNAPPELLNREVSQTIDASSSRIIAVESKRTRYAVDGTSKSSVTASGTLKDPYKGRRATKKDYVSDASRPFGRLNSTMDRDESFSVEERVLSTSMRQGSIARRSSPAIRHVDELGGTSEENLRPLARQYRATRHLVTADDLTGVVAAGTATVKPVEIRGYMKVSSVEDTIKPRSSLRRSGPPGILSQPQAVLSGRINSALFSGKLARSTSHSSSKDGVGGVNGLSDRLGRGQRWSTSDSKTKAGQVESASDLEELPLQQRVSATVASRLAPETPSVIKLPPLDGTSSGAKLKSPQQRCAACKKKIGLATTYVCKCELLFCPVHKFPEEHACTFDYKSEGKKILRDQNPQIGSSRGVKRF